MERPHRSEEAGAVRTLEQAACRARLVTWGPLEVLQDCVSRELGP